MSFPQIYESGLINDFPRASYSTEETDIDHENRTVKIRNDLQNCKVLENAISRGEAIWSAELRSPHALHSVFEDSADACLSVTWDDSPLLPPMYLFATLVATKDFMIRDGSGISPVWRTPLEIPKGAILAKSRPHEIATDSHNLLHVRKAEKGTSEYQGVGMPVVKEDTMSPQVRYIVHLPEDIYTEKYDKDYDRSLLVGALAEALRKAAKSQIGKWEDPDFQFIALKEKLEEIGANWDDDDFSPLLVASRLVPFEKLQNKDEE